MGNWKYFFTDCKTELIQKVLMKYLHIGILMFQLQVTIDSILADGMQFHGVDHGNSLQILHLMDGLFYDKGEHCI